MARKKRKITIAKALYGKKTFTSSDEFEFYRSYKMMKLDRKLVTEVHEAVGIAEGYIPVNTAEEELNAWQLLIDTGVAWKLQGWFGRQAMFLIDNGLCKTKVVN